MKDLRETNTRVISDERILGSSEFAETVLRDAKEAYEKRTEMLMRGITFDQLVLTVSEHLDLEVVRIKRRGRKPTIALARSAVCALAFDRLGMSNTDIARKLNITQSAVSWLVTRGGREPLLADIEGELP